MSTFFREFIYLRARLSDAYRSIPVKRARTLTYSNTTAPFLTNLLMHSAERNGLKS